MADKKITELTNITGANLVDADEFVVVDISADETKAITLGELKEAFDSGSGFVRITGDTMTGDLTVPNVIVSGNVDGRDVSADGTKLDGIEASADVTDATNVAAAGAAMETGAAFTGDVTFGDNDKAIFGAGSDLQIYHDPANGSIVKDNGTGRLLLDSENGTGISLTSGGIAKTMISATKDGDVKLYYDNSPKLATTSTGIDVTGTVTADGLTVDNATDYRTISLETGIDAITDASIADGSSFFTTGGGGSDFFAKDGALGIAARNQVTANSDIGFFTKSTQRMEISDNGDISFYEDTGTTPKFFWDASAERLGIGTSSPSYAIDTLSSGAIVAQFKRDASGGGSGGIRFGNNDKQFTLYGDNSNGLTIYDDSSERMRIDSSGNLGIGVTPEVISGYTNIQAQGSSQGGIFTSTTSGGDKARFYVTTTAGYVGTVSNQDFIFLTNDTERMRIDASGNLLVGKTSSGDTGAGHILTPTGAAYHTFNGGPTAVLNRLSSDGDIAVFRKDGSTVGSIGTTGGKLYIGSQDGSDAFLRFESNEISPCAHNGSFRDNVINLGKSVSRFDDIYATNGTIQTSDRNEKQDIEALSDAEQRVAVACKGLLRKFRWIDAVAEKGDDARIHFGIIAQDLQDAFAAEGLDAGRYAMFISSTWTDEETGEERTRMGVRYPELLAFIIAAI